MPGKYIEIDEVSDTEEGDKANREAGNSNGFAVRMTGKKGKR